MTKDPERAHDGASVRTCVGCGARVPRGELGLVRLVIGPAGELAVDAAGGAFGRGAHVHATPSCIAKAPRGLARSYKRAIPIRPTDLAEMIRDAMTRRARGLLASAARADGLVAGADAVSDACKRADAVLVVVATDASAAAELGEVRRAIAEGRAVAWGTKRSLADALPGGANRTEGIAVLAITESRIATALRDAVQTANAVAGLQDKTTAAPRRGDGHGHGSHEERE